MENTLENTTDIAQIILDTINTLLGNLFSSIDNNLYSILDKISFVSSDILHDSYFESIFGTSATNGILLISNSLLFGFLLYYASRYLLAHLTYVQAPSPFRFLIKLVLCGICMNFSFFIVGIFLDLNSYVSLAIRNLGETLWNKNICFSELILTINNQIAIDTNSLNIFSIDGLIKGILSVSLLNLVFSYSFRYMMIKLFVLLSPFAFLSLSLPSTSWFFKAWFKNLFSLLFLQIIISLVLLLLFYTPFSSTDLLSKFIYLGGIYVLIKANSFIRDFIGGVSTTISQSVKNFKI